MDVEFDPVKDQANIAKHGVSLQAAAGFDWDTAVIIVDDRFDYGEDRFSATGYIADWLYVLVYADGSHDGAVRAISLRKAEPREVRRYEA